MSMWRERVQPPQRDVGELARLQRADLVLPAEHPRPAHRGQLQRVPHGHRPRAAAGAGEQHRVPHLLEQGALASLEAAPSTPSPTRHAGVAQVAAARRCRRRAGRSTIGQCATPVPVAAMRGDRRVVEVHGVREPDVPPSQPSGLHVLDRRAAEVLAAVLLLVERLGAGGCAAGRPLRRASSAASVSSSAVTENGEQGATADPHHRVGRRVVVLVDRRLGRGQDRVEVLDHVVRRQAALRSGRGPSSRGTGGTAGPTARAASISAPSTSPPSRGNT